MRPRLLVILFAIVMAALPLLPNFPPFWLVLLDNIGLAALVAIGLVLLTGVGGLTSFGQAAFCGFGAYTTALLTTSWGFSPWLSLPFSLIVSGAAAVILGLVTVRLSGHYLPLGTIAWGLSLYYLFSKMGWLGRNDGIPGIPPLTLGSITFSDPGKMYYVIWACVIIAGLLSMNLLDSRTGRAIRALRRGHLAAESFGVETAQAKLVVFIYAAMLAGLSGWLYAHFQRGVNPTPFGLGAGIEYLFVAVAGGAGFVWGAILGSAVVTVLKEILQDVMPRLLHTQISTETIVFGTLLVLMLQLAPRGLWPMLAGFVPWQPRPRAPSPAEAFPQRERPPAGNALLKVTDARKQFGGVIAVNNVNFDVDAREIVALIGPNGAGKTTTFNLITGALAASGGTISFRGEPILGDTPQQIVKRGIARTFQHVKLVPDMSVLENVALGAHLHGNRGTLASLLRLDRHEEARLLAEAARQIERVGLSAHMHDAAGSLALGQQRIVELARALCADPLLLLLDEPAAGLRFQEKQRLAELLRQLQGEGLSILLVEHDMTFVMTLANRVVVLDFGTKIANGTPDDVKTDPKVIAAYLGVEA